VTWGVAQVVDQLTVPPFTLVLSTLQGCAQGVAKRSLRLFEFEIKLTEIKDGERWKATRRW
jgi:hypothetical protein